MLRSPHFICALASSILALHVGGLNAQQTQIPDQQKPATTPVSLQSAVILSPTNSRISFIGIHVGDDPKPRLGGFKQFHGYVVVNPDNNSLDSVVIDINVDSVWTQFEKLTRHLKNADFFESEKFPSARFVSSAVKAGEGGQCEIWGELTLHGQTKAISFPAQYRIDSEGLLLEANFKLDRAQFGMDKMLSGVDSMVEVEIFVGQQTMPAEEQQGHGGDETKSRSAVELPSKLRQVSVHLPNMT